MLAYLFLLIAIAYRILAHPWNFTPVAAALLFFGARMPRRQMWIPLTLLAMTDVGLNLFRYHYPVSADLLVTWAWYAAILLAGSLLTARPSLLKAGAFGLGASISFFLLSNFVVWAVWNMYPRTLAGLVTCYAAAVPFFRQPVGDVLFTVVFFSVPMLLEARERRAAKNTL